MLNISLVSALLHPRFGGPSEVLRLHALGLSRLSNVSVFGICDSEEKKLMMEKFQNLRVFEPGFPNRWFYGKGLYDALSNKIDNVDAIHAHMLWDYPVYASWKVAKAKKIPLIITPHGTLNSAWRYRGVIKGVYRKFILDHILDDAACIHVLNKEEEIACRNYGIKCPIQIIPNGLPCETFDLSKSPALATERWSELSGRRIMLYLGRLWHGKGLDILPDAWLKVKHVATKNGWLLVIAGPDYGGYKKILERKISDYDLTGSVLITGPVYGEIKESLIAASTAYVLPSHGEGFSMALLEAVAAKRPALFTEKCNFSELSNSGGGWEVKDTVDGLAEAFRALLEESDEFFRRAGLAGWKYAREMYSLETVSSQLISTYQKAIDGF
jgi:glycosyltransferase involved in cell wall biosynthesis